MTDMTKPKYMRVDRHIVPRADAPAHSLTPAVN